jgi:uncharacterized protein (DUF488 family)
MGTTSASVSRSFGELTRQYFGEALSVDEVLDRLEWDLSRSRPPLPATEEALWVGSIGYEAYRDNADFVGILRAAGVRRLIDVRELPISRRRGYAKTALSNAAAALGIEYVHVRALGNPKPYRDLYKSGRRAEGRLAYHKHLLREQRTALDDLVVLLREKPSALMCLERDPCACHRTVIIEALQEELGLRLDVVDLV